MGFFQLIGLHVTGAYDYVRNMIEGKTEKLKEEAGEKDEVA
jgi:hypothetical protein